jgi:hypothetical protein
MCGAACRQRWGWGLRRLRGGGVRKTRRGVGIYEWGRGEVGTGKIGGCLQSPWQLTQPQKQACFSRGTGAKQHAVLQVLQGWLLRQACASRSAATHTKHGCRRHCPAGLCDAPLGWQHATQPAAAAWGRRGLPFPAERVAASHLRLLLSCRTASYQAIGRGSQAHHAPPRLRLLPPHARLRLQTRARSRLLLLLLLLLPPPPLSPPWLPQWDPLAPAAMGRCRGPPAGESCQHQMAPSREEEHGRGSTAGASARAAYPI